MISAASVRIPRRAISLRRLILPTSPQHAIGCATRTSSVGRTLLYPAPDGVESAETLIAAGGNSQKQVKGRTGELRALVGVEDFRPAVTREGPDRTCHNLGLATRRPASGFENARRLCPPIPRGATRYPLACTRTRSIVR